MADYNYLEAHIFRVTTITSQAEYEAASALTAADLDYIGLCRQESGYKIDKEEQDKSSINEDLVLSQKLTINLEVLTQMDATARANIDGKRVALLFADPSGVDVDDAGNITITGTPTAKLLSPTRLYIAEDEKFGTGKVSAIVITGENIKSNKDKLRKDVSLSQN